MTISISMNDEDTKLVKEYVKMHNISVSEFMRKAAIRQIEDEYDLKLYKKGMEEYQKNPVTYTHDEVKKLLDI